MAARIEYDFMTEHGGRVIATAQYGSDAAANGQDAWSCLVSPAACSAGTR